MSKITTAVEFYGDAESPPNDGQLFERDEKTKRSANGRRSPSPPSPNSHFSPFPPSPNSHFSPSPPSHFSPPSPSPSPNSSHFSPPSPSPSPNSSHFSVSATRRHLPLGNEIWNARQRIREQTKSMVEQRKLAKRLSMMGQTEERDVTEDNAEIGRADAQIEQSIKLAEKYLGESQRKWTEEEAKEESDVERGETVLRTNLVTLARPIQSSAEKEAKMRKMLKWGEGGRTEDKMRRTKGTSAAEERREIGQQSSPPAAAASECFSDQSPPCWSDRSLLLWSVPQSWSRWVRENGTRQWAGRTGTRLWLNIHRLEFDHHWLFTETELREHALLRSFEAFVGTHERALKAAKEWLMSNQMADEAPLAEEEDETARRDENEQQKERPNVQLDLLLGNFLRVQKELNLCLKVLERAWNSADQTHGRFVLRRLEGHAEIFEEECEGGVPDELRNFFHSPMFLLSERESDEPSTDETIPAAFEEQRKKAVITCHYQIQIFFNDIFVCASDPVPLHWPSFCVLFGRIFDFQVFERTEQVRIRLLERLSRMAKWQEIAEIFVPLPTEEKESRKEDGHLVGIQFASTVQGGGFKGSLGCGERGGTVPFMQGRLFCALKATGGKSDKKHRETREKEREKAISNDRRLFSPSLFPRGAILCSAQLLSSDLRLKALEKRWSDWDSRPRHRIGLSGEEIIGEKELQITEDEQRGDMKQKGVDLLGLEARKRTGREMAFALRHHLRQSVERWRHARDSAELVREEPLPTLSLFPQLLISRRPFDFSRRLKPMRRHPLLSLRRPLFSEQQLPRRRLILNIQFASFLPNRFANGGPSQIFLQFSTKANSVRTTIVDGRHANWQETLVLEVDKLGDNGEEGEDCLELDMFDVEVRPMERDDRERDTRHEREERRWLGTARVPIRALIALGKADGYLTLQSPIFHTGYRSYPTDRPITVRLLVTIDPFPPFPTQIPSVSSQFEEHDYLLSEGTKFENRFRQRFPNRRILANVRSSDGKKTIASRFLRSVAPPAQILSLFSTNPKQAVSAAAQIAASVPIFVDTYELVPTKTPIWSTINEILRFGTASADELGTLLCCWLLGLQLSALLLLGFSLSDGPNSAAVLVKFPDGEQWLIIPSNGHHFDPSDPTCPFLSVGTILAADNVYVNLQNALHPSQLDFDLANGANWTPLLRSAAGIRSADCVPSVQSETVIFGKADENQLIELRTSLERDIRLHFDHVRPFAIPQWNLLASRILREVLVDSLNSFPDHSGSVSRLLDIESRLEQLQPAFRPSALAFRFPFFSRAQIVHQMLRTQVHLNSEPHAQFALALHLQPMVGDAVLGCAVAFCTLLPNKPIN